MVGVGDSTVCSLANVPTIDLAVDLGLDVNSF